MQTLRIEKLVLLENLDEPAIVSISYRKKSDADIEDNYTIVSSGAWIQPDGTLQTPLLVHNLSPNTEYVIRCRFKDFNVTKYQDVKTTSPITVGNFLNKVNTIMPNMQVETTNELGILDSYLPVKTGLLHPLNGYLRDIFENFGNFKYQLVSDDIAVQFKKYDDEVGINVNSNVVAYYPNETDSLGNNQASILGTLGTKDYSFGFWFYLTAYELSQAGTDGKLWLLYCGSVSRHIGVFIDKSTNYLNWVHVKDGVTESIILDTPVTSDKWHKVFIRRNGTSPSDPSTNQILMRVDNTNYTPTSPTYFSSATNFAGDINEKIYLGFGRNAGTGDLFGTFGTYRYFFFRASLTDDATRDRIINPPYPSVIIQDPDGSNSFAAPFNRFASVTNTKVAWVVPSDAPTGSKRWFYQTSTGNRSPINVNIIPFQKLNTGFDIDFSNSAQFEANKTTFLAQFNALHKAWGGYANGGVVGENIYFQDGKLVLEAHGDNYDGTFQGVNRDGTPKTHTLSNVPGWGNDPKLGQPWVHRKGACIVSKGYLGFGRYLFRTKIPQKLGVAPAWWLFHYEEAYPNMPEYEVLLAEGMQPEGNANDGFFVVRNHEIDIEQPSHLAMGIFDSFTTLENEILFFHINDNYHIGIETTNPTSPDNGLYKYKPATIKSSRTSASYTISSDGRTVTKTITDFTTARSEKAFTLGSGKKYFEVDYVSGAGVVYIGIGESSFSPTSAVGIAGWTISSNSRKFDHQTGGGTTWGGGLNTFAAGDTIGIMIDTDAGTFNAYKSGILMGQPFGAGFVDADAEILVATNQAGITLKVKPEKYDWKYPQPSDVTSFASPNNRNDWTKISNEVKPVYSPDYSSAKFNTWIGETGNGGGWRWKDGITSDSVNNEVYLANLTPLGIAANDDQFHDYEFRWYKDRVEFYFDGVLKQVNKAFVPNIPSKLTIGPWFPSATSNNGSVAPWLPDPKRTWGGYPADWNYQKFVLERILFEPYDDITAGGNNRLIGESYPFDGIRSITL